MDPAWLPYGVAAALAGIAVASFGVGWAIARRWPRAAWILVVAGALGIVIAFATIPDGAFGMPIAIGIAASGIARLATGSRFDRAAVVKGSLILGIGGGIALIVAAALLIPTPELQRTLMIERHAPAADAIPLNWSEVEAIAPHVAAGLRVAPEGNSTVNAPESEYVAFWDRVHRGRAGAPSEEIVIEGAGFRIAQGPVE